MRSEINLKRELPLATGAFAGYYNAAIPNYPPPSYVVTMEDDIQVPTPFVDGCDPKRVRTCLLSRAAVLFLCY